MFKIHLAVEIIQGKEKAIMSVLCETLKMFRARELK